MIDNQVAGARPSANRLKSLHVDLRVEILFEKRHLQFASDRPPVSTRLKWLVWGKPYETPHDVAGYMGPVRRWKGGLVR